MRDMSERDILMVHFFKKLRLDLDISIGSKKTIRFKEWVTDKYGAELYQDITDVRHGDIDTNRSVSKYAEEYFISYLSKVLGFYKVEEHRHHNNGEGPARGKIPYPKAIDLEVKPESNYSHIYDVDLKFHHTRSHLTELANIKAFSDDGQPLEFGYINPSSIQYYLDCYPECWVFWWFEYEPVRGLYGLPLDAIVMLMEKLEFVELNRFNGNNRSVLPIPVNQMFKFGGDFGSGGSRTSRFGDNGPTYGMGRSEN